MTSFQNLSYEVRLIIYEYKYEIARRGYFKRQKGKLLKFYQTLNDHIYYRETTILFPAPLNNFISHQWIITFASDTSILQCIEIVKKDNLLGKQVYTFTTISRRRSFAIYIKNLLKNFRFDAILEYIGLDELVKL